MLRDSSGKFLRDKSLDTRSCFACGSNKTYIKQNGRPQWATNKPTDLYLCKQCFDNIIYTPDATARKIRFKNKRIVLPFKPRKGECKICHRKIRTNIHHIEYHEDDPMKDTLEICIKCHNIETLRLGQRIPKQKDLSVRFLIYWRYRWRWLLGDDKKRGNSRTYQS